MKDNAPDRVQKEKAHSEGNPDFIEKLWNGDLSLAATYWVWGVLAGFVWAVFFLSIRPDGTSESNKLFDLTKIVFYFYYGFVYVGIWNSATKYTGNKIWGVLAKFIVIISIIPVLIEIIKSGI